MKDKKYFCYEIYKNLAIWSHNGKLGYNPCSFFTGYIKESTQFNLKDIWNSPEHQALKDSVENNIPIEGCKQCYAAEAKGFDSRRLASVKLYEEFHQDTNIELDGPQGIDYSVGNLCNLKCVICTPSNSSRWIPDYQQLYPLKPVDQFQFDKYNQLEIVDYDALKNIKTVHFHGGGEPLMAANHINLLNRINEVKGLSDVRIFYNTNGTQIANEELLELWKQCKLVELYFSLDDVGPRFNYQRTGADWDHVTLNLKWFFENMPHNHMFKINCTWGYMNLFYLNELLDWYHDNFSTNRYGDLTNFIFQKAHGDYALNHLSADTHKILMNKFKNYPSLVDLVSSIKISDQPHDKFWNSITALDRIRNSDFKLLCPEWSKLL